MNWIISVLDEYFSSMITTADLQAELATSISTSNYYIKRYNESEDRLEVSEKAAEGRLKTILDLKANLKDKNARISTLEANAARVDLVDVGTAKNLNQAGVGSYIRQELEMRAKIAEAREKALTDEVLAKDTRIAWLTTEVADLKEALTVERDVSDFQPWGPKAGVWVIEMPLVGGTWVRSGNSATKGEFTSYQDAYRAALAEQEHQRLKGLMPIRYRITDLTMIKRWRIEYLRNNTTWVRSLNYEANVFSTEDEALAALGDSPGISEYMRTRYRVREIV